MSSLCPNNGIALQGLTAVNSYLLLSVLVWARWILIGLWPRLMFEVLRKLLQGCGIVWPVIIASTIGAVVNAASCYFTIHVLHWGLIGAAVSVGLYQWSMFLSLVLIFHLQIRFSRYVVLTAYQR
jgi:Na+-driven multidrug efflux pump